MSSHNGKPRERFGVVEAKTMAAVCASEAGVTAFAVYFALATFRPDIRPGIELLAEMTGLSRPTVERCIRSLETCGFISRELRPGKATRYAMLTPITDDATPDRSTIAHDGTPDRSTIVGDPPVPSLVNPPVPSLARGEPRELKTRKKTSPSAPSRKAWEAAADSLRPRINQASHLIGPAQRRGWSPEQLIAEADAAFATLALTANQGKAESPGGVVFKLLLEGSWPIEGLVSLEEAQRQKIEADKALQAAKAAQAERDAKAAAFEAETAILEAHAATLDAMSFDEQIELAPEKDRTLMRQLGPISGPRTFRRNLLKQLEAKANNS